MEQTNLFSLSYKRKMSESVKVVPFYLKRLKENHYFFDSNVENFDLTKEEYLGFCDEAMDLYSKIDIHTLRSRKLWILRFLTKVGISLILGSIVLLILMTKAKIIVYKKAVTVALASAFSVYFSLVTSLCVYYIIRVFRTHKFSASSIKKLNMFIFKLNIRYRVKGLEFTFQTSSKELVIKKIL